MESDIMNSSQIFNDAFENYCFKSCFLNVLRYYGLKNAEHYMEYSLDWTFTKTSEKDDPFQYQFGTGDVYSSFQKPFVKRVHFQSKNELSMEEIWECNKQSVQKDIPVIVQVDVFYLKYTPYYGKKHSFHSLILAGYDEQTDDAYVIDWYKPWYYKGRLPFKELHQARDSANELDGLFSGTPINYLYSEIERDGWSTDKIDSKELIIRSIQDNLDKYYIGKVEGNQYKGYHAIIEIAKLIEKNESLEPERRIPFLEDLHQKLYFIVTRKKLFYWYLEKIKKDFPFAYVEPARKQLSESMEQWRVLLTLIIKCSISNENWLYENIMNKMYDILIKEKQFYCSLYELSKVIFK